MVATTRAQSLFCFTLGVALYLLAVLAPIGTDALNVGRNDFQPAMSRAEDSVLLPRGVACSATVKCGMGLCCSTAGYCGTDAAHCVGSNCVSQCHASTPTGPSCPGNSAAARTVGYWQSANLQRSCEKMTVAQINTNGLTHLNFAFVIFDTTAINFVGATSGDSGLWTSFTNLKSATLQTWVSVGGGGNVNCPPAYWSTVAADPMKRSLFIANLKTFLHTNAFQGADLDWEFPTSFADMANYVSLVSEMRTSFGSTYGISFTMPPDLGDIQYYQALQMLPYVDFINFMAYDIAFWGQAGDTTLEAQTNKNYIAADSTAFWFDAFTATNAKKINLGMALYGRGYTLPSSGTHCTTLGCPAIGFSTAGPCTNTPGILSLREVEWLINSQGLVSTLNSNSMIKYITWGDQWVAYDDVQTIALKTQWASSQCWGGTALWSIDFSPGPLT